MGKLPEKYLKAGLRLIQNPEEINRLLRDSTRKAEEGRKLGHGFLAKLKSLFRLTIAYTRGEYREIPFRSFAAVVGALLYFVNPMDLFPDVLLAGFIDDAAIVGMVLASLRKDLEAFSRWEESAKIHS